MSWILIIKLSFSRTFFFYRYIGIFYKALLTTKKHRPHSSYVCKNSALSAPSGGRTLDTLIEKAILFWTSFNRHVIMYLLSTLSSRKEVR